MNLSAMPKTTETKKKRVGRGYGSGKGGHTVGRGAKGQKARSKVKIWFEGGQLELVRRLPKTRGKGRFKPLGRKPVIVNLKDIAHLPKGALVTAETLSEAGIVKGEEVKRYGVKILGEGTLKHPLRVKVKISESAKKKVISVGGTVE